MKDIDESRFQKGKKPEPINFSGATLPDAPSKKAQSKPSDSVRPDGRTAETKSERVSDSAPTYVIRVPHERRITRHPFDLYEDQIHALRMIKLAEAESGGSRKARPLGELAREALDDYIAKKARKLEVMVLQRHDEAK
jgi:endonuclease YncB( thermonuclease family)